MPVIVSNESVIDCGLAGLNSFAHISTQAGEIRKDKRTMLAFCQASSGNGKTQAAFTLCWKTIVLYFPLISSLEKAQLIYQPFFYATKALIEAFWKDQGTIQRLIGRKESATWGADELESAEILQNKDGTSLYTAGVILQFLKNLKPLITKKIKRKVKVSGKEAHKEMNYDTKQSFPITMSTESNEYVTINKCTISDLRKAVVRTRKVYDAPVVAFLDEYYGQEGVRTVVNVMRSAGIIVFLMGTNASLYSCKLLKLSRFSGTVANQDSDQGNDEDNNPGDGEGKTSEMSKTVLPKSANLYVATSLPECNPTVPLLMQSSEYTAVPAFADYSSRRLVDTDSILTNAYEEKVFSLDRSESNCPSSGSGTKVSDYVIKELGSLLGSVSDNWKQFLISAITIGRPWFSSLLINALYKAKADVDISMDVLTNILVNTQKTILSRKRNKANESEFLKHQVLLPFVFIL